MILQKRSKIFFSRILRYLNYRLAEPNENFLPNLISLLRIKDVGVDDRIYVRGVNTILEKTLDEIIDKERFVSSRVLEIGPKFGITSLWIDSKLKPSKFVMLELPQKSNKLKKWVSELKCPHEIIYESIFSSKKLMKKDKFDLIFCTGVLYHTVEHFKILNILRRLIKNDGIMVFQSSIARSYAEDVILLNWTGPDQKGSYAFPSNYDLITMLTMTCWSHIKIYADYRSKSNTMLLTCQKSKDVFLCYDGLPFGGSIV